MSEIHPLEPVSPGEAWPHEALDFTPWLAGHLDLLGAELDLDLELEQVEATLPRAGRVDILARQTRTGNKVVIENQLGSSDDSHCLRLMGYAANADANILVWVAQRFTDYHRSILDWLNATDTIDVYAVEVKAYRVGDALAASFRRVVEPPQSQPGASSPPRATMSTRYAEFYRPLVAQLRLSGVEPLGRGGWRGRWRSFQAGYSHVLYGTGVDEGKAQVFLNVDGPDQQNIYHALTRHKGEIDSELNCRVVWEQADRNSWVMLETEADVTDPEQDPEAVRQWMADNLLRLQAVMQPYLDQVMRELDPDRGDGEDAE